MANYPFQVPSGVSIVPEISGQSSLGSSSLPFNTATLATGNITTINATTVNAATISGNALIITATGASSEYKLTNGSYSRWTRASGNDVSHLYNQVMVAATAEAVGGTITRSGGYTYHTFTTSGTFNSTSAGTLSIDYLVVGGGAQGGGWQGGGGGGGGYVSGSNASFAAGTYPIVIGSGGTGAAAAGAPGANGGNSIFNNISGIGGGGGDNSNYAGPAGAGGTGGGGANNRSGASPSVAGQGFAGGNGGPNFYGGGGGAGAVGGNGSANTGGNGGAGKIWLDGVYYGGGGGGAGITTRGSGAVGGGANGSINGEGVGGSGTSGLGGGGGGSYPAATAGGPGGSGVVKLRYVTPVSSTQEANLVSSSGSSVANEWGINTFGDALGATHLDGNKLYFDIAGVNQGILTAAGFSGNAFISPVITKTGTYTATSSDSTILCSGTFQITLPTASGISGKTYNIKNIFTGTVTVSGTSPSTIDGASTQILSAQWTNLPVISDGSNWYVT